MALSTPVPREHRHTRTIACEGYRRQDGDWDIEARIIDTKPYDYEEAVRGHREAGSHVHNMAIRLTINSDRVVRQIEVEMPAAPYPACPSVMPAFQGLIGKQIGAGWRRAVAEAVGGKLGCTHMRELLFPMATVAFQTINSWTMEPEVDASGAVIKPYFIDGCKAWAAEGEMVAKLYPRYAIKAE